MSQNGTINKQAKLDLARRVKLMDELKEVKDFRFGGKHLPSGYINPIVGAQVDANKNATRIMLVSFIDFEIL